MFSSRIFHIALFVSLLAHGIILSQSINWNSSSLAKKEKAELKYVKEANLPQPDEFRRELVLKREALLRLPAKVALEGNDGLGKEKERIFKRQSNSLMPQVEIKKPELSRPDIIAVKRRISLPAVDSGKINSPSYLGYYQALRERIKQAAYANYTGTETGEVYLTFVILKNGMIKEVRLLEKKTGSSIFLQETALRSIREAAPFPDFPKELDYPQLSFNVIISFEVD